MNEPQDQPPAARDADGTGPAVVRSRRIDLPTGLSITFGCRPIAPPPAAEPDQSNRPRTSPVSINM